MIDYNLFEQVKDLLDSLIKHSYELVPSLENVTTILSYMIVIGVFLMFFILPLKIIRLIFNTNDFSARRTRKRNN